MKYRRSILLLIIVELLIIVVNSLFNLNKNNDLLILIFN